MKVLHIAYSDAGGAGGAARTWIELLSRYEESDEIQLLVVDKTTNCKHVIEYQWTYFRKIYIIVMDKLQRFYMDKKYPVKENIIFSTGFWGINISALPEVRSADVIHLHWINGFLSVREICKLHKMGKKIIWTMHDSWPITGGCHVGCEAYRERCGDCRILRSGCKNDLSSLIWRYKKHYLSNAKILFTAPSEWMRERVRNSALFHNSPCIRVPNTIDFDIFHKRDKKSIRETLGYVVAENSINVLFAATSLDIPYKGYSFFVKVLCMLYERNSDLAKRIHVHYVGSGNSLLELDEKYPSIHWGEGKYISDKNELACIYSLSDVMIYPSMSDSFSLTCLECIACQTPVVAFKTGGVPEIVRHCKSGYIAEQGNSEALLEGLLWVLGHNQHNQLGIFGREDVRERFAPEKIAEMLQKIYHQE